MGVVGTIVVGDEVIATLVRVSGVGLGDGIGRQIQVAYHRRSIGTEKALRNDVVRKRLARNQRFTTDSLAAQISRNLGTTAEDMAIVTQITQTVVSSRHGTHPRAAANLFVPFFRKEEIKLVVIGNDRATDGTPKVIEIQHRDRAGEEVAGIQGSVADKLIKSSMVLVTAGL